MKLSVDERGKCIPWAASILTGLTIFAFGWESPQGPLHVPEDGSVPMAPALTARTLERAPLVRVRQHEEAFGCLQHHDPTQPCAMYAPGYKPSVGHEDTPDPSNVGEFVLTGGQWPQPGGIGTTCNVSYSYSNLLNGGMAGGLTANQLKAGVQEALSVWAAVSPLNFTEVADSGPAASDVSYPAGSTPNLRIGHHNFDGAFGVLAHAYFPGGSGLAGDLHFDNAEPWAISPGSGKIDFIEVAVHEFGHALGLNHEPTPPVGNDAIMNPFYGARFSGPGSAFLLTDDKNGIKAIYGSTGGGVCPIIAIGNAAKLLPFAAGIKLGAVARPEKLYANLRQYRDRVLQGTPAGRQLVAAYYQHGPEIIQIMAKRPDLTIAAIELLAAINDPVARRDGKTDVVRMPKQTYKRGLDFLVSLEEVVSEDARLALVHAREVLDKIHTVSDDTVALDFAATR